MCILICLIDVIIKEHYIKLANTGISPEQKETGRDRKNKTELHDQCGKIFQKLFKFWTIAIFNLSSRVNFVFSCCIFSILSFTQSQILHVKKIIVKLKICEREDAIM